MAKVVKNEIVDGLSGRLGRNLVVRHMKDGRRIVLTRPGFSSRVFSQEQLGHQSRFQEAAAYARAASKTNAVYAELAAGTSKNAYNLALSDWFKPPTIRRSTRAAGAIRVDATDNIRVARVHVTVFGEEERLSTRDGQCRRRIAGGDTPRRARGGSPSKPGIWQATSPDRSSGTPFEL